jgi:low temperature requirement protein LtrA
VFWFVIPYLVVRLLGLGLQVRIDYERGGTSQGTVYRWAGLSLVGLTLVLLGGAVDPPARNWIWLAAIAADLFAAARGGAGQEWDIAPAHFSERHGLFVIIALGESLIVAAAAVSAEPRTGALIVDVIAALVVAGLLWWTYFGWLKEGLEHGLETVDPTRLGATARDAFSLGHFPLICGIIAFAVALQEIVHHPAHVPSGEVVTALGVAVTLFVFFSAFAYWRTTGEILVARVAILVATMVGFVAVSALEPAWQLAVLALGLLVIVVVEGDGPAGSHDRRGAVDVPDAPDAPDVPDGDLPLSDD